VIEDLRYAARSLRKNAGLTAIAVATLALGIGASTAIFGAIRALLFRPLPVENAERIVVGFAMREGFDPFATSLLEYALYRSESRSFEESGMGAPRSFELAGRGEPEHLPASAVTFGHLATLGVRPALGRLFTAAEDRPGGPAVALLGYALWQRRFGGDAGILGRPIDLDGRPHTIIGILPPGFDMPYASAVWVPMQVDIESLPLDRRAVTGYEMVARLKPGVTLEQADRELKELARRLETEYPQIRKGWSYRLIRSAATCSATSKAAFKGRSSFSRRRSGSFSRSVAPTWRASCSCGASPGRERSRSAARSERAARASSARRCSRGCCSRSPEAPPESSPLSGRSRFSRF
jgi:hypothetical protein